MGGFLLSAGAAIVCFIISYAIFNAALYQLGSLALSALKYGLPVGAICGFLVFVFVYSQRDQEMVRRCSCQPTLDINISRLLDPWPLSAFDRRSYTRARSNLVIANVKQFGL